MCVYVYMYVCMYECIDTCVDVRLTSSRMVERILLIFRICELVHHRSEPSEYEPSSSKNWGSSDWTQKVKLHFLNGSNDFD
jgi:hypothetical protein